MDQEVRDAIRQAASQDSLNISGKPLDEMPAEIRALRHLKHLYMPRCGLKELPDWLPELENLEHLDLSSNQLTDISPLLTGTSSLRSVVLHSNRIARITGDLRSLARLDYLNFGSNQLSELPASIGALRKLADLDISGNEALSVLPAEFAKLTLLKNLYMWGCGFTEIPIQLRSLTGLQLLEISANGSSNRNEDVTGAIAGRYPNYSAIIGRGSTTVGTLREIPSWIGDLIIHLRYLYAGGHAIRDLPPSMAFMTGLRGLYLASNYLAEVPDVIMKIRGLEELDLRNNRLTTLPAELQRLTKLKYLDLAGNQLAIPPEILAQPLSAQAILDYAVGLGTTPSRPLNEAKLLFVGEGSVGKTSLIKRIAADDFDSAENKTEGIDITRWSVRSGQRDVTLNIWDFGGQEIMHATHQFFLTKRSIYVLVIDCRQDEEQNRLEYWLKLIQGFSGGSPVILVANKSDQHPLDIDQRGLRRKYPEIVDVISTSCVTKAGLAGLRARITQTIGQLSHIDDRVPEEFFAVKMALEDMTADSLSFDEYRSLCAQHGVTGLDSQELLVGFLHDLGTVLCFRDDPRLAGIGILNPSWVTGGVYRLLNSNLAALRKGLLRWADIDEILKAGGYPADRRILIVDMMRRFELCYESEEVFLLPDLLTKDEPDTGEWRDCLHFEVRYDVLPSSVMSRLIVRMNEQISKRTVWRTGMVLKVDRNRALVKADRVDSVIAVDVQGPEAGRRGLLTAIRTELRAIERTIPGLEGEERVPVPGLPGIFVPYQHLIDLEAAGRETVVPLGTVQEFSVRELLAGVEATGDRVLVSRPHEERRTAGQPATGGRRDEAAPWTIRQSAWLAGLMLAALIVIVGISVGAYELVGATVAVILGLALAVIVVLGLFVLRVTGRITDQTFASGLKGALSSSKQPG